MTKRPLLLVSSVLLLLIIMNCLTGNPARDSLYDKMGQILTDQCDADGVLTLSGRISKCVRTEGGIRLNLNNISFLHETTSVEPNWNILVYSDQTSLLPGDRIRVRGKYFSFSNATNPGEFDSKDYYKQFKTLGQMQKTSITMLQENTSVFQTTIYSVKNKIVNTLYQIMDPETAGFISAINMGENKLLDDAWKDDFTEGGLSHLFSISGLHIALIGMTLYSFFRKRGISRTVITVFVGILTFVYVWITNGGISTYRALILFYYWMGAQLCGRKNDPPTILSIAAVIILFQTPDAVYQASFWLSFSAAISLSILGPYLFQTCHIRSLHARRILNGVIVWAGTLPAVLFFYYQTPIWSILFNLLIMPMASTVMAISFFAVLTGMIWTTAGIFLGAPVMYLTHMIHELCLLEEKLVHNIWLIGRPGWLNYLTAGMVLFVALAITNTIKQRSLKFEHAGRKYRGAFSWIRESACGRNGDKSSSDKKNDDKRKADKRKDDERKADKRKADKRKVDERKVNKRKVDKRKVIKKNIIKKNAFRKSAWKMNADDLPWVEDKNLFRILWGIAGLVFVLCLVIRFPDKINHAEITFLDVGQGDCTLLELTGNVNCLVDGGSSSRSEIWEYVLKPVLKYKGISKVDYIFLSHSDTDHMNGIEEFLEDYEPGINGQNIHGISIGTILLPSQSGEMDFEKLRSLAKQKDIKVEEFHKGDLIAGKDWKILCLGPDDAWHSGDANDDSMVMKLESENVSVLFTGDIGIETEKRYVESGQNLQADVLKVAHHGSRFSNLETFYKKVKPKLAVISVGKNNRYGHPGQEVLNSLEKEACEVRRTDEEGAIKVR